MKKTYSITWVEEVEMMDTLEVEESVTQNMGKQELMDYLMKLSAKEQSAKPTGWRDLEDGTVAAWEVE